MAMAPRFKLKAASLPLLAIFIVLAGTYALISYSGVYLQSQRKALASPGIAGTSYTSKNAGEASENRYAVNTPTCKIPEMDPMDASIQNFLQPGFGYPVDCKSNHRSWTFMNGRKLTLNKTAVRESGYSTSSIHCCYRIISRVEQPLSDYNLNGDNYVKYSDECRPIQRGGTDIDAEFIRVHCISKSVPLLNDVVYRDFFAIAQPHSDRLVSRKLFLWDKKALQIKLEPQKKYRPPPNVVIIGIDNNSRLNAHRHLRQTLSLLRKLGAVELLGYTKVGENTFPNMVPFLSGYSEKELEGICYQTVAQPQDECPYIWKAFDSSGYVTVHAEDSPYLSGFNYLKTGFLRKPTDFYLRTLMLAVMTHMPRFDYYHTDCIGRHMTDELVFNYVLDIINMTVSRNAPAFVHSWLTSVAHYNYNNLQFSDSSTAKFIQSLVTTSNDNSIFLFMSDHGQRYGPIRETSQGWYEDKLPTQWIYLPQHLRERYPSWYSSLLLNARRLTSHFDVFKTLLHILHEFDEDNLTEEYYKVAVKLKTGQSLFLPVPENRTCEEAGITVNICACSKPEPVDVQLQLVKDAARAAVEHLGNIVPLDVCAKPILKKIVSASYLNILSRPVYVIVLVTDPGEFLFEVNVEIKENEGGDSNSKKLFVISTDLLRMNKISRAASCVNTPLLERYCYCK